MAWDISAIWNTGDINARTTNCIAVIDREGNGTPHIIAPVQHGVKCFDEDGNLEWTYNSITNGYDVRDLAVGNLNGTGKNDCVAIASGYYNTSTDGKVGIVDKDGNQLDLLLTSDFSGTTAPTGCYGIAVDGTDIYVSTNRSFHKFSKSGSTWSESWYTEIGPCAQIQVANMGNGKRIYVAKNDATSAVYCYQTDGTEDWHYHTNNSYQRVFAIGKSDSTKTGNQMAIPFQSGFAIIDKDGNLSQNYTAVGNNVRCSVFFYDCDGDGEDEIYYNDMGDDVICIERTAANTYTLKYQKADLFPTGKYGIITHFDINADGDDEIICCGTDGHIYIYDKTLSTLIKDINVGHGTAGGYFISYQGWPNGIFFVDTSLDGNEDIAVSGSTGYADVLECSGFGSFSPSLSPSLSPSNSPSLSPSSSPSQSPSQSISPSKSPSISVSVSPSISPSLSPSISSSISPSPSPGWQSYTKGDYVALPTTDADLEGLYSAGDILNVATKDNQYVDQTATSQYAIHQFKDYISVGSCTLEWEGKTNLSPVLSTVYLQIYNQTSNGWETVDSDNSSPAATNFTLTSNIADLTDYKDASNVISCRVYQLDL